MSVAHFHTQHTILYYAYATIALNYTIHNMIRVYTTYTYLGPVLEVAVASVTQRTREGHHLAHYVAARVRVT